jgi:hypothetical protein
MNDGPKKTYIEIAPDDNRRLPDRNDYGRVEGRNAAICSLTASWSDKARRTLRRGSFP